MPSPTGLMLKEMTGAAYQFKSCWGRGRAANSLLCDRQAVCGPVSICDSLSHAHMLAPSANYAACPLTFQLPALYF